MYLNHFGLDEAPFSITPDPRFVYLSERHRDGLAHLLYGVGQGGSGGFVQLTGEVGTGKTTLCRLLLEQLPAQTEIALVLNPRLDPVELVETICQELKLDVSDARLSEAALDGTAVERVSLKRLVELLNVHLLKRHAEGWRVVAMIDEAQDLSPEALEQVRLLTNLETAQQKLLQIILIGQPELRSLLERPDLRQLAQRITARFHLTPLDVEETAEYLRHRLAVAGTTRPVFTRLALRTVHKHAGGVPRVVNVIADRALLAAYVAGDPLVGERAVSQAAREALYGEVGARRRRTLVIAIATVSALLIALLGWWVWRAPMTVASNGLAQDPLAAASVSASPVARVPLGTLMQQVAGQAGETWRRYLQLWVPQADAALLERAQRCPETVSEQLHCLRGSGSLGKLRGIARPVLLKLSADELVLPALLLAIEADQVLLELAGQQVVVHRDELERHWYGDYLALWPHPADMPITLGEGAGRVAVQYLKERLQASGASVPEGRGYTSDMREAVRQVQRRHGLLADGIVGPETWLVLSTYDASGPRLAAQLEAAQ
jgi:general secretion pathway protein A